MPPITFKLQCAKGLSQRSCHFITHRHVSMLQLWRSQTSKVKMSPFLGNSRNLKISWSDIELTCFPKRRLVSVLMYELRSCFFCAYFMWIHNNPAQSDSIYFTCGFSFVCFFFVRCFFLFNCFFYTPTVLYVQRLSPNAFGDCFRYLLYATHREQYF